MGEAEDSQKLKRPAAAYDYDNDPRWTEYWANVLIPPRMASRSDVVDHFKFKFYQRYIDPDLVEAISTHISSQPVRPSTLTSTPAPTDRTKPRELGSATRASGTTRTSVSNPTSLHRNQQTIQIFLNAWVAFVVMLVIFPLVPRNLSNKAYQCSFIGMISSSLYSMFSLYGKPSAWNLQGVQVWLQSIIVTKEFIYFTYCLIFVTSHLCLKFSLVPILCQAFVYIAKLLRCNFSGSYLFRKYLEKPCVWVESNTTTLNILSSEAEIVLGFLLILSLFSWQRNILQTFMYWQLLKLMYHTPATAGYHQSVWAKTGRALNPILHPCAPYLNAPISSIQRWWFRR